MLLAALLPQFTQELASALTADGRNELASQLGEVSFVCYTYDTSVDAAYICLHSPRNVNSVDEAIVEVRHGETVPVEHRYWVNLDVDNSGRLTGIELLSGGDVAAILANTATT